MMTHDRMVIDRMREWGATPGQVEHAEVEFGLRDIDQPTRDPDWWRLHGTCNKCDLIQGQEMGWDT